MANNCSNYMIIGEVPEETFNLIEKWKDSYENFDYVNDWVESILSPENYDPTEEGKYFGSKYGGRWFDIYDCSYDNEHIVISGDSAWSPMIGLAMAFSKQFDCQVELEYEEGGCDFAGKYIVKSGEVVKDFCTTVAKYYEQEMDEEDFIQFVCDRCVDGYDGNEDVDKVCAEIVETYGIEMTPNLREATRETLISMV